MHCNRVLRHISYLLRYNVRCYASDVPTLTNCEVIRKRNALFEEEKARQLAHLTRIEKIMVHHRGPPESCALLMNKGLSTPFNCAMHIQELLMTRSALALVNGQPWDMHRPLQEDCELEFLHFRDEKPDAVNTAFWRSCSFLLGYIMERAFKDQHYVELCSFPWPNVKSGSFVYDADLKLPNWTPTTMELNCLSRIGGKLGHEDYRFERLEVDASVAKNIFQDNRFKSSQIPSIASKSSTGNTVVLYRMSDHIDMSTGPLISSTNQILRFTVTSVHNIESPTHGLLNRIQGMATPTDLKIHYWAYDKLCERAANLNPAQIPGKAYYQPQSSYTHRGHKSRV